MIKSQWVPSANASQKRKTGCLFFLRAPYPCCCFWVEEGCMLFLLLALLKVLWNRRPTALCFIGVKSPGEPELVSHISRKDYPSKVEMWRWTYPHLSGSQVPSLSLLSCQEAQKACELLLEKAKWAWRGSRQLGILPGFPHSQCAAQKPVNYSLGYFFSQWRNLLSEISSQLCSVLLLLLQMGKPKWPREPHIGKVQGLGRLGITAGLQSWLPESNHECTSEMSDVPSRITYAYSL